MGWVVKKCVCGKRLWFTKRTRCRECADLLLWEETIKHVGARVDKHINGQPLKSGVVITERDLRYEKSRPLDTEDRGGPSLLEALALKHLIDDTVEGHLKHGTEMNSAPPSDFVEEAMKGGESGGGGASGSFDTEEVADAAVED